LAKKSDDNKEKRQGKDVHCHREQEDSDH